MTSKGQITVPADVRRDLGLTAGAEVDFVRTDDGDYRLVPLTRSVRDLKGVLSATSQTLTVEQMDEAIGEAGAGLRP